MPVTNDPEAFEIWAIGSRFGRRTAIPRRTSANGLAAPPRRASKDSMTSRVLLAFDQSAAPHAQRIASKLGALGYEVGVLGERSQARGDKVVMLWSRAAWGTPALRAAARRAHAAGKLVCIRLDAAPPPVRGVKLAGLPRGRADQGAWRRLLHPKARTATIASKPATAHISAPRSKRPQRTAIAQPTRAQANEESASMREPNSRGFAIALTLALIAVAATGYAYQNDARVAAPIDRAANSFYTEASKLAALAP